MPTVRFLKVPILVLSVTMLSSCDWVDGLTEDPNLKMTFSCHGDRRMETYTDQGNPDVVNEKVSHSITFWRLDEEKNKKGGSRWNKYKVNRYALNGEFQDLTRYDGLKGKDLENAKKNESFHVFENFGVFRIRLFTSFPTILKNKNLNDYTTLTFNFVTRTLDIDVWERNGTEIWSKTYDRTRCEQVTDPNTLEEMSVIQS